MARVTSSARRRHDDDDALDHERVVRVERRGLAVRAEERARERPEVAAVAPPTWNGMEWNGMERSMEWNAM